MLIRTDEYMSKLTMDALDRPVHLDATIRITMLGSKLKAYCEDTGTFVQFPRDLRKHGRRFVADVIQSANASGTVFYRAYKGSIRETKNGNVVA
jgi:hypothetical protein